MTWRISNQVDLIVARVVQPHAQNSNQSTPVSIDRFRSIIHRISGRSIHHEPIGKCPICIVPIFPLEAQFVFTTLPKGQDGLIRDWPQRRRRDLPRTVFCVIHGVCCQCRGALAKLCGINKLPFRLQRSCHIQCDGNPRFQLRL